MYVMAGWFSQPRAEWNVLQDISAARTVFSSFKGKLIISPFELGFKVKTGLTIQHGPVRRCLQLFAEKDFESNQTPIRYSWDPCTVLSAIEPEHFSFSQPGTAVIGSDGVSNFSQSDGNHFVIDGEEAELTQVINTYITTVVGSRCSSF
jgi:inosine-uridine nucleoside N-ribohydrolase